MAAPAGAATSSAATGPHTEITTGGRKGAETAYELAKEPLTVTP